MRSPHRGRCPLAAQAGLRVNSCLASDRRSPTLLEVILFEIHQIRGDEKAAAYKYSTPRRQHRQCARSGACFGKLADAGCRCAHTTYAPCISKKGAPLAQVKGVYTRRPRMHARTPQIVHVLDVLACRSHECLGRQSSLLVSLLCVSSERQSMRLTGVQRLQQTNRQSMCA